VRSVPPVPRRARAEKLRINNTTGVSGVFCQVASSGKVRAWVAKTYMGQDEILRTDFPVDAVGDARRRWPSRNARGSSSAWRAWPSCTRPRKRSARRPRRTPPSRGRPSAPSRRSSRSTNSSGVSGVHFKAPNVGHPGYWLAITYTAGKGSVSKAFSIKDHGPDLAKQMAIEERERQLEAKLNATGVSVAYRPEIRQPHPAPAEARPDL
jgi:hypothetical protein